MRQPAMSVTPDQRHLLQPFSLSPGSHISFFARLGSHILANQCVGGLLHGFPRIVRTGVGHDCHRQLLARHQEEEARAAFLLAAMVDDRGWMAGSKEPCRGVDAPTQSVILGTRCASRQGHARPHRVYCLGRQQCAHEHALPEIHQIPGR